MTMLWDPQSPSLRPTIVCYADLLGFRAETQRAFQSGTEADFLQKIKRSLDKAYEIVRKAKTLSGAISSLFDMKVFTDNIVVAYPLRNPYHDDGEIELGTFLMLFARVQASLASDGYFLRGAIAYGSHYQDDDIAYGEALLEAAGFDQSGKPPRLVIAPSVEPLIARQLSSYGNGGWAPHHQELLEDPHDEHLFINYLGVALEDFPDCPIHSELLQAHRDSVFNGLLDHEADPHVRLKYEWLAVYNNYVCRTFAERFEMRANEYADPEEMAISEEAQRARDYLVPIESSVQPPRPLDAQRLRQHLSMD